MGECGLTGCGDSGGKPRIWRPCIALTDIRVGILDKVLEALGEW